MSHGVADQEPGGDLGPLNTVLLGWWVARRRLGSRVGPLWLLVIYTTAMAGLFLAATAIDLVIEYAYRNR